MKKILSRILGLLACGILVAVPLMSPEQEQVSASEILATRAETLEQLEQTTPTSQINAILDGKDEWLALIDTEEYKEAQEANTEQAVAVFKGEVEPVVVEADDWTAIKVDERLTTFQAGDLDYNERLIIEEAVKQGITVKEQVCYILATAKHESASFKTLTEYADGSAYEYRSDLGNVYAGDGTWFKGRGFVQITGRLNYTKYSEILGVDLIQNPQLVSENTDVAVFILVHGMRTGTFTGKTLDMYIGNGYTDYYSARQIVNGLDVAGKIAAQAEDYCTLI